MMNEKKGVRSPVVQTEGVTRRKFFKMGAAVALVTGLSFGSSSLLLPSSAQADSKTKEVCGQTLRVVSLSRRLSELDTETEPYRDGEHFPSKFNKYTYSNAVLIPEQVTFIVSLNDKDDKAGLAIAIKGRDKPLYADLKDFSALVENYSGSKLDRVKIVIERGVQNSGGKEVNYSNAYIIPVDYNGEPTTKLNDKEYLVFVGAQLGDRASARPFVMADAKDSDKIAKR